MPTVHATQSAATKSRNTVHVRRKNPTPIACSGCSGINNCTCLDQLRLMDEAMPLVQRLLGLLARESAFIPASLVDRLLALVELDDQRKRESGAISRNGADGDRQLLGELVGDWGYSPKRPRSVEAMADRRGVPVERVRALLARFFSDASRRAA